MQKLNRKLIDAIWPHHDRSSCSDASPFNGCGEDEYSYPDCHRCFALDHENEPLADMEISASIKLKIPDSVVRDRALQKLNNQERRVLGLD